MVLTMANVVGDYEHRRAGMDNDGANCGTHLCLFVHPDAAQAQARVVAHLRS